MYLPLPSREKADKKRPQRVHLTQGDMMLVIEMFTDIFGPEPLQAHPDLSHREFDYVGHLPSWQMAIALQIAVDVTAACKSDDERVVRLKKHFYNLLGTCENETTVILQSGIFVIERPPASF